MVAHYVNKEGKLGNKYSCHHSFRGTYILKEELLIDFRELVGEHSGENMAEVIWETLKRYGIENRVSDISMKGSQEMNN